jgi:aspartate ammonia-lyase
VLERASTLFRHACVEGILADPVACARGVERSWATVTALLPKIGYEAASILAAKARSTGVPVAQLAVLDGLLDQATVDALLSPEAMTALGYRS